MKHVLILSALLATTAAAYAADPPAPAKPPMVLPHGESDVTKAIAGTYTLDPRHVSVIAYVSHMGFSLSAFRFEKVSGTLQWDPNAIAKSTLTATVETASISSNVPGFATELAGEKYLNSGKFPEATFVSTAFHQTNATHGKVEGTFTLKGKSAPMTFDVTLVGAGPGFAGGPVMGHVIGIHAEGMLDPQAYDMGPFFKMPIKLVIDTEFDHKPS
ncbi:MAG: polyisoprenoid-binding protein [Alphaproteobacteria bacterium]|nr:polyisoprenoid-binding protein [Alphaproteobacteria bacterium]